MDKKQEQELAEQFLKGMVNLRNLTLKSKPHIKKYLKVREIHNEICQSMLDYFLSGKYDFKEELKKATPSILKELNNNISKFNIEFDTNTVRGRSILAEYVINKNHPEITSITEIYIKKKRYTNEDKVKMLKAMNKSYVGLFKVISTDVNEAYLEIEDVFTKERFKIIDIGGSIDDKIAKNAYYYNRIITVDDISFGTGIHIIFNKDFKGINNYIKNNKKKKSSDIVRLMALDSLCKSADNKAIFHENSIFK